MRLPRPGPSVTPAAFQRRVVIVWFQFGFTEKPTLDRSLSFGGKEEEEARQAQPVTVLVNVGHHKQLSFLVTNS